MLMQKIVKSLKLGRLPGQIALGLTLVLIYTTLNFCSSHSLTPFLGSQSNTGEAVTAIIPPLSTRGSQIVDATGRVVRLRGVSWFGLETTLHTPHGLWVRDYKQMLAQIKSLGYNVIRLPYSVQSLRSQNVTGIDFSIGANKDFYGKTPLDIMDRVIQEAQRQGLLILLDSHQL